MTTDGRITDGRITDQEAGQAVASYVACRREEQFQKKGQEAAGAILKQYLQENPGSAIYDEATDHTARLITSRKAPSYDVASMPDGLVLWAARHGLLTLDHKAFATIRDKFIEGVDIAKFATPGAETTVLRVERRE